jgi:hypothetical protein
MTMKNRTLTAEETRDSVKALGKVLEENPHLPDQQRTGLVKAVLKTAAGPTVLPGDAQPTANPHGQKPKDAKGN